MECQRGLPYMSDALAGMAGTAEDSLGISFFF